MFKKNYYQTYVILVLFCAVLLQACASKNAAGPIINAESAVSHVSTSDLNTMIDSGEKVIILDVRDPYEYEAEHITDSINMSRGVLDLHIEDLKIDKTASIVVY